ncbi:KDO transferase A [Actinidia rufa]|uniref:KDO transferase A n=1 Tax=Actinidia rufa TaxID=165716 RepID=A0A7J0GIY6_9ERIC|nr:KDO transferase A [Actinidia rufa]
MGSMAAQPRWACMAVSGDQSATWVAPRGSWKCGELNDGDRSGDGGWRWSFPATMAVAHEKGSALNVGL